MSNRVVIHERFMNGSRIILPRVGVGVGGGVGVEEPHHALATHQCPVAHLATPPQPMHDGGGQR